MSALIQGSDEWLAFRKSKIGASDAPPIMGVSPWRTPYQLWFEKVSTIVPTYKNSSMQRGLDLEERARNSFEEKTGIKVKADVKLHPKISYMIASLDGIDEQEKNIVEIKCPNRIDHEIAKSGLVPEKYIPQLQHQLEVCGLDMAYYFSFDGENGALVEVYRDEKYIKKMLEKEKEFYECMQNFIAPEACERDFQIKNDDVTAFLAGKLLSLRDSIKKFEEEENALKQDLLKICGMKNTKGKGFKLTKTLRKGNVDYSSIEQLKGINLETYRKYPIETWRVSSD